MEDQFPSLVSRIQSIFIDTLFVVLLMIIVSFAMDIFPNTPNWLRAVFFISIFVIYEPLCLTFGCTIGNYILRIRVKKFSDTTNRINFFNALIRYAVKVFLGWISFVTIHSNPSKRALHDLVSGSVMIKVPKN